jgi:hypothetical protein
MIGLAELRGKWAVVEKHDMYNDKYIKIGKER